jgi:dihydrofolate synthase / folylpolyglutamate synthase
MLDRLYALSKSGTQFGLERIARVLEDLGHPELEYRTAHIAGSNGKGSTSAFLAAILGSAGKRVGLYTSPHLISLTERIQFLRGVVPSEILQDELTAVLERVDRVAPNFRDLSFFEVLTAAGLSALAERNVEFGVIEAGLGARLDATRLVDAEVAILTDLSLEHTQILGDTIEEIALEEGAVMRPGRPLVMADGPPAAMRVIDEMARACGAKIHRIGDDLEVRMTAPSLFRLGVGDRVLDDVELSLLGPHQGRNAVLAAKTALLLEPSLNEEAIRRGLASAQWPGRMEIFEGDPKIVLDGAHNPHGAEVLRDALKSDPRFASRPLHLLFGVLADKNAESMLEALVSVAASMIVTNPASPRARPAAEVAGMAARLGASAEAIESIEPAFEEARRRAREDEGWVVVCGSLYLVGDVRAILVSRSSS